MQMTLTVHVPRRRPRPVDVLVRWTGEHTAHDLCTALADHLGEPVPGISTRGSPVDPEALVGVPPLVHGASVAVVAAREPRATHVERPHHGRGATGPPPDVGLLDLAVVGGPDAGRAVRLGPPGIDVGRSPELGLSVADPSLSRVHARVQVGSSGITLLDRGSTNGVSVDGVEVQEVAALDTSSTIVMGSSTLALRRRPGAGLPVRHPGDGHVVLTPAPATPVAAHPQRVEAPSPPPERHPTRVPWLAALVPVPIAGVLAVLIGPQLLAFALLGPVAMLANALGDRWGGGRRHRRAVREVDMARRRAAERLDVLVRQESAARRARHPDPHEVLARAEHRGPGLWGQPGPRPLRVGLGDLPAETTWVEDAVATRPTAPHVPVTVDLLAARRLGVVGPPAVTARLLGALIGQLVADLPPSRLRLVVQSCDPAWAWTGLLPHVRASDAGEQHSAPRCPDVPAPCRVVVVPAGAERRPARVGSVEDAGPVAVHGDGSTDLVIVAASSPAELATACGAVLTAGSGPWRLSTTDGEVDVSPDLVGPWWTDRLARALAPLTVADDRSGTSTLPPVVRLAELYGVEEITAALVERSWGRSVVGPVTDDEQAGRPAGWAPHPPRAPVGASTDGIHEIDLRRDGPHVLVGGTTGSGKSEFLRTLVASLAVSCPPDALGFVLVDFKGGSAFGSCAALPHVLGLVTDLDDHLVDRALRSLGAELRRREALFATVGARDLDDYHRRRTASDPPVGRLVVVIDELRALVEELPEFVSGMVRIAALGRSLGVHLVLATQRPSGAITPEVQANVNLRIAFRVRDRADSLDVIDDPGAASLPAHLPGRAMSRGGGVEAGTFQAAVIRHAEVAAPPRLEVSAADPHRLTHAGRNGPIAGGGPGPVAAHDPTAALDPSAAVDPAAASDPAAALVAAVRSAHARSGRPLPASPWLDPLPAHVAFGAAASPDAAADPRRPAVALVDRPDQQRIDLLEPDSGDIWLLCGPPGSGRTTAARAMALAWATRKPPEVLHMHVIEGGGGLDDLEALPHLGTRCRGDEHSRLRRLVERLSVEVEERLRDRASHAGTSTGRPSILLLVDGWEQVAESQPETDHGRLADDVVRLLRDGPSVGVRGVVTGGRSLLQPRWAGVRAQLVLLGQVDPLDAALSGLRARDLPADPPPGRAIRCGDRSHLQFVAAGPHDTASVADGVIGPDAVGVPGGERVGALSAGGVGTPGIGPRQSASDRPWRIRDLPTVVTRSQATGAADGDGTSPRLLLDAAADDGDGDASPPRPPLAAPADGGDGDGSPPRLLLGVAGDDAAPLWLDPATTGRRLLVVGPPRSGRTATLRTLAESCLHAGTPVAVVTAATHEWSSLEASGVCVTGHGAPPARLIRLRRTSPGLVLLVDHADRLDGTPLEQVVREVTELVDRDGGLVVLATTPRALATRFRGIDVDIARERAGLLLCPAAGDGEVFGLRGLPATAGIPGRGVLVAGSETTEVQVLAPQP